MPDMVDGASTDLLEVKDLRMYFPVRHGGVFRSRTDYVKAVDGVSFSIKPGEALGLVGESGCGKTTVGSTLLRALDPTAGEILYKKKDGQVVDLAKMSDKDLVPYRRELRMIFQDP